MALQSGNYVLTANSSKLFIYTYKEGFLSAVAHDLLIDVTHFTVNLNIPPAGSDAASVHAEIQANSLKVICAMKDGLRQNEALKEKDKADIEDATSRTCSILQNIPQLVSILPVFREITMFIA